MKTISALDSKRLFDEIIKSDIGGQYKLASAVSEVDADNGTIFQLYDDRGITALAKDEKSLEY